MKRVLVAIAILLIGLGMHVEAAAAQPLAYKLGQKIVRPAAEEPRPGSRAREIGWEALVPKDWEALKKFRSADLSAYSDADPRADALLREMREAWDNAPVVPALDRQAVRIPGFVVPLEQTREGISEFLLVPYYGSCIHTPAPPSNQIIHVALAHPVSWLTSMLPIWLEGTLSVQRNETLLGASSYRMLDAAASKYEVPGSSDRKAAR
jgi:hypothetical protein